MNRISKTIPLNVICPQCGKHIGCHLDEVTEQVVLNTHSTGIDEYCDESLIPYEMAFDVKYEQPN